MTTRRPRFRPVRLIPAAVLALSRLAGNQTLIIIDVFSVGLGVLGGSTPVAVSSCNGGTTHPARGAIGQAKEVPAGDVLDLCHL